MKFPKEPVPGWVLCLREGVNRPRYRCAQQDGHTCSQPLCPHRDCPGPHYRILIGEEVHP